MTYTREAGVKWQNEVGKTSHMKVLMVHSVEDCEKECTATAPCVAYTFIPGMEICALKAPKDAVTTVDSGMSAEIISGKLDEERSTVGAQELDSTICLPCLPGDLFCHLYKHHPPSQHATLRKGQSIPVTTCTHWALRHRRSVQLPVFGSQSVISGRTTPTWAGAG